jgi:hypothetical protein
VRASSAHTLTRARTPVATHALRPTCLDPRSVEKTNKRQLEVEQAIAEDRQDKRAHHARAESQFAAAAALGCEVQGFKTQLSKCASAIQAYARTMGTMQAELDELKRISRQQTLEVFDLFLGHDDEQDEQPAEIGYGGKGLAANRGDTEEESSERVDEEQEEQEEPEKEMPDPGRIQLAEANQLADDEITFPATQALPMLDEFQGTCTSTEEAAESCTPEKPQQPRARSAATRSGCWSQPCDDRHDAASAGHHFGSASRRLFGGGYHVSEDLFDNAMSPAF